MNNAPCFNCQNRRVEENYNCHFDCPLYLDYCNKNTKRLEEAKEKRVQNDFFANAGKIRKKKYFKKIRSIH